MSAATATLTRGEDLCLFAISIRGFYPCGVTNATARALVAAGFVTVIDAPERKGLEITDAGRGYMKAYEAKARRESAARAQRELGGGR